MHMESLPSLMCLCLTISSASVGGIRQSIFQILRIDATLMGYCIASQVRTMTRSIMCKSNLRMGENILRRVFMIPCVVLLREHFRSVRSIAMLGSGRGIVDDIGDAL